MPITTTFRYRPLESNRHIRLLRILEARAEDLPEDTDFCTHDDGNLPKFDIVHVSVDGKTPYETVSYAWGDSTRVAELSIVGTEGNIGLTRSLVDALPRLVRKSHTRLLWIGQVCINQNDVEEQGEQVALMGDVFRNSATTLIWLGLDDYTGELAVEIIRAVNDVRSKHRDPYAARSELKCLLKDDNWCYSGPQYKDMAGSVVHCSWLSRGWVVQEYILSKKVSFLCGEQSLPQTTITQIFQVYQDLVGQWRNTYARNYMGLNMSRDHIIQQNKPIDFSAWLRIMANVSGRFETTLESDGLFAYLGLWKPKEFQPSYTAPLNEQFTDLARCIARETASLDFLATVGFHNLDQLPTWVPVWTDLVKFYPWSIVTVSSRRWNAANNRQHNHIAVGQPQLLRVQGRIVDRVIFLSDDRIRPFSEDLPNLLPFIEDTTHQYSQQWPGRTERLTAIDVVKMLNECEPGGPGSIESPQQILRTLEEGNFPLVKFRGEFWAWGRDIMASNSGRFGMVSPSCQKGDLIAIIHGCSIPLVLSKAEDGTTYKVRGDCFLQGCMNGEAVTWEEEEADEILLS